MLTNAPAPLPPLLLVNSEKAWGGGGVSGVGEARESDHDSALLVTALAVSIGCERAVIINRYSETMFQGKCDRAKRGVTAA